MRMVCLLLLSCSLFAGYVSSPENFLQRCEEISPFHAFLEYIEVPINAHEVYSLSPEAVSLVEELARKILDETSPIVKGNKEVRPLSVGEYEIPMHSTHGKGAVAGNHASGDGRKIIAVVVTTSDHVLCRQAYDSEVREQTLGEYDIIMIESGSIHAFGMPPETHLLLFPDRKWTKPSSDTSRILIPWDYYLE